MIQVSPLCLLFENGVSTLTLTNKSDEKYYVTIRSTNSTAYKYDMEEILLDAGETKNIAIEIVYTQHTKRSDAFRVSYRRENANKEIFNSGDVLVKVLLSRHNYLNKEVENTSIEQQINNYQAKIKTLVQETNQLKEQLSLVKQERKDY